GKETVKVIEAAVPKKDGTIIELNKSVTLQGKNKQNWVLNVSSYSPLNWVLVSAVPQKDLTAPGRNLAIQQALLQVLLLLIGLTAGILISRRITGPVETVTKAARDLSENKFDPSDLDAAASRTDEVGDLARAFQRMGVDLVERERKLREQVASLKVVIDRSKLAKDIGEITESEFFQDLAAKAEEMRKKKFD
ncbi:MAG: HAMP domain-containing protein, partial [Actinomycetes bacterium]